MKALAFLGFGEAARAFRATLAEADPDLTFKAWDIKLDGPEAPEMAQAMAEAGVAQAEGPAALAADWIVSAVTADQSLAAIAPLVPALGPGMTLVDINSVSPGRKREAAAQVERQGARYLDMAVMAPVRPRGHRTPVLVAGAERAEADAVLDRLGFDWSAAGEAPGEATAVKMVRSVFVKGLEAITAEALLAAERSGCLETVRASLAASFPGLGWPDHAAYVFERTLTHGTRRAAEMRESAATLAELGLAGQLAEAIADVQAALGAAGRAALDPTSLEATLRRTSEARSSGTNAPED